MSQRFPAAQNTSSLTTWISVLDELTALKYPEFGNPTIAGAMARAAYAEARSLKELIG